MFIRTYSTRFVKENAIYDLSPLNEPCMRPLLVIITKRGSKGYEGKIRISFKFLTANFNAFTSEI